MNTRSRPQKSVSLTSLVSSFPRHEWLSFSFDDCTDDVRSEFVGGRGNTALFQWWVFSVQKKQPQLLSSEHTALFKTTVFVLYKRSSG